MAEGAAADFQQGRKDIPHSEAQPQGTEERGSNQLIREARTAHTDGERPVVGRGRHLRAKTLGLWVMMQSGPLSEQSGPPDSQPANPS